MSVWESAGIDEEFAHWAGQGDMSLIIERLHPKMDQPGPLSREIVRRACIRHLALAGEYERLERWGLGGFAFPVPMTNAEQVVALNSFPKPKKPATFASWLNRIAMANRVAKFRAQDGCSEKQACEKAREFFITHYNLHFSPATIRDMCRKTEDYQALIERYKVQPLQDR